MTNQILSKVRGQLTSILPTPPAVLLAVSGGSDSMGLLHLMVELREMFDMRLGVAIVDHGLRDVASEVALVKKAAQSQGVPVLSLEIPKDEANQALSKGSIQAWARERRYKLLADAARQHGFGAVATGHTLDDQAETVMLRLLRGCGVDGLRGMLPSRPFDDDENLKLIRPLLTLQRAEIRSYLADVGILYADDPSNENDRFLRVRVRNELLPLMDALQTGVARRLAALADDAAAIVDYLSSGVDADKMYRRLRLAKGVKVTYSVFDGLPPGFVGRIVRGALKAVRGDLRRFERCHISPIEAAIRERRSTDALSLPGDIEAHVYQGNLYVFKAPLPDSPTGCGHPVAIGSGQWRIRFKGLGALAEISGADFDQMDGIVVRAKQPGDRLYRSTKRFKEILIRGRIPRPYRSFVPVLALGDEVIASPGLLSSRKPELTVHWLFDETAPFLDVDFA